MQAAFELANLYSLDSLMSLDSYTGSNGSLERVYISLGDSYQKSYKNLEKAYEYYIDATILAEKGNNITNAIEYFHKALEVLSQNRKDENLNILATKVFEKVEKKLFFKLFIPTAWIVFFTTFTLALFIIDKPSLCEKS